MSTTQAVREHFQSHPGEQFDNAQLREALDIDDGQSISVALNQMFNNGEIQREKKDGMGYAYWMGTRAGAARKGGSAPVSAKAAVAQLEKLLAPRAAAGSGDEPRSTPARARANPPAQDLADAGGDHTSMVLFSVRSDGMLGIDNEGQIVALRREDVQRLQVFLSTTEALWGAAGAAA